MPDVLTPGDLAELDQHHADVRQRLDMVIADPSLRAYRDEIGDVQWHHQFATALWRGIPADDPALADLLAAAVGRLIHHDTTGDTND